MKQTNKWLIVFNEILCNKILISNKIHFSHNYTKCFLTEPTISFGITFNTLNLTVLDKGLLI